MNSCVRIGCCLSASIREPAAPPSITATSESRSTPAAWPAISPSATVTALLTATELLMTLIA